MESFPIFFYTIFFEHFQNATSVYPENLSQILQLQKQFRKNSFEHYYLLQNLAKLTLNKKKQRLLSIF